MSTGRMRCVFIFEWTQQLRYGDPLDVLRLMHRVPRDKRIVIDCDGNYNDALNVQGDYNHRDAAASQRWIDACDSLADRVFQPTLHPKRPNVRPFFFHGYDPAWEQPLDFDRKEFGMVYVGHSKFRLGADARMLDAVEPDRERGGATGGGRVTVGMRCRRGRHRWGSRTTTTRIRTTCERLGVEFVPPVPYEEVIPWMGRGTFNPGHLSSALRAPGVRDVPHVRDACGQYHSAVRARGCLRPRGLRRGGLRTAAANRGGAREGPGSDVVDPEYYADVVMDVRRHIGPETLVQARVQELVDIVRH